MAVLALRVVADLARRARTQPAVSLSPTVAASLPGRDPAPDAVANESIEVLHRALEKLEQLVPWPTYQVIILHSVEGHPIAEVAARLGLTAEQVRYRHYRGVVRLRRLVAECAISL